MAKSAAEWNAPPRFPATRYICPHRGSTILYDPSSNAKRMTCIFHQWSFDARGNCIDTSRGDEGYQDRFCKPDASMREVATTAANAHVAAKTKTSDWRVAGLMREPPQEPDARAGAR